MHNFIRRLLSRRKNVGISATDVDLASELAAAAEAISRQDKRWPIILNDLSEKCRSLREQQADAEAMYGIGREVESLFGGMMTLNALALTGSAEEARGRLYSAVQVHLKRYWRRLGREWNEIPRSDWFRVGDHVKMIRGQVLFIKRNGEPKPVPISKSTYEIYRLAGTDITNMPLYWMKCGSKHQCARHNALRKVAP